mmetsp:Transcript_18503/g.55252  ORF Transcript_18503/g.55252 Transcript_18503/m.55252 type:complete len:291 (+) Transcript_18503:584-1456(+)
MRQRAAVRSGLGAFAREPRMVPAPLPGEPALVRRPKAVAPAPGRPHRRLGKACHVVDRVRVRLAVLLRHGGANVDHEHVRSVRREDLRPRLGARGLHHDARRPVQRGHQHLDFAPGAAEIRGGRCEFVGLRPHPRGLRDDRPPAAAGVRPRIYARLPGPRDQFLRCCNRRRQHDGLHQPGDNHDRVPDVEVLGRGPGPCRLRARRLHECEVALRGCCCFRVGGALLSVVERPIVTAHQGAAGQQEDGREDHAVPRRALDRRAGHAGRDLGSGALRGKLAHLAALQVGHVQ